MAAPLELKNTLNLPRTDFSMKANLPQNEPKMLARWEQQGLYQRIRQARKGAPVYILHDGPPYANGEIHLGHALNKGLKDFVVKSKTMAGFDSPYVPGWDCHGLPIEIKVDEALGRKKLEMPPSAVRKKCREYAEKYLNIQREQFKRLGILGRWDQPYSTMTPQYESVIVRQLFDFMENGAVYKGLRPVYWCIHDKTALAEAEIEYANHTSPSVWVKYRLTSSPEKIDPALSGKNVSTIIWTTTPWTLPASMAVAFHPDLEYVALEHQGEVYIVAEALAKATLEACHLSPATKIAQFPGRKLELATFAHPFLDRQILGVLAEYVTTDQGTGAVHTAPSHGADDFYTGSRYKLDQRTKVDEAGRLQEGLPEYDGKQVFQANQPIIELLKSRGVLMAEAKIEHSYPHCWRCHNPVIFRATEQWFISMEAKVEDTTLRQRSLDEIKKVKWIPAWGEERISNMIAERPDWCISRQRVWGVPIIVFYCEKCREPLTDRKILDGIVTLFQEHTADIWYERTAAELLPPGTKCAQCGGSEFSKENDILDVWFDSGSSHLAVLNERFGLPWPSDMYIEGGDQYRGWFQSSLLVGTGIKGSSPYRACALTGWTLDGEGRAMHKSLGNAIEPEEIIKHHGADILRLWAASVQFSEDVRLSETILTRLVEAYRKLRNTFRYLLSNLFDFDPARDAVDGSAMPEIDQWILLRAEELTARCRVWYENYEFHRVYHSVYAFATAELSAVYIDVVRDRLYTSAARSSARRSAQTALYRLLDGLVRLLAPLMSFTAEEVWTHMKRPESVHMACFPEPAELSAGIPDAARKRGADWDRLMEVRDAVLKSLENARNDKLIGAPLEARVRIAANGDLLALLACYARELPGLFIVSQVALDRAAGDALTIQVERAEGTKCERCWKYTTDVGADSRFPTICKACADAVDETLNG